MITITIVRDSTTRIVAFVIEGHAKYAKAGRDIVCAGVSAISVGTVNAIEKVAGVELPAKMKDGWLSSDIPKLPNTEQDMKVQLILESMIVMLDTITKSYDQYVRLNEQHCT